MAKKTTTEDASLTKLRQIATAILKDDGMSAKDRAAVVSAFADDHADVVLAVIEGQLALAAAEVLGEQDPVDEEEDDEEEEDEDDDSDEGDPEDEEDDGDEE